MPAVNPKIMKWARETAGLSVEEAARKIELGAAHGQTPAERLLGIEAGREEPSRRMLQNMAKKYRRSLVVFYLQDPPEKGDRGEDFRRIQEPLIADYRALVDALVRDIRSRQELIHSIMEDQEADILNFVGSASLEDGAKDIAEKIIQVIDFELMEFRSKPTAKDAFGYLRYCIERKGIFVLLAGDLGSHHTDIPPEVFRGYVISDPLAPLIVINDNDAYPAWSFTALHEIAHLWLGSTGISGLPSIDVGIEKCCNDVAGEILLPADDLHEFVLSRSEDFKRLIERISGFANERNISRSMVSYKLYRSGALSKEKWQILHEQFHQDWLLTRERSRQKRKEEDTRPNYYTVRRHRLGHALLDLVGRALSEGIITYTKAARVLGVKPRKVEPLLQGISYQGESL